VQEQVAESKRHGSSAEITNLMGSYWLENEVLWWYML